MRIEVNGNTSHGAREWGQREEGGCGAVIVLNGVSGGRGVCGDDKDGVLRQDHA